jgi:hypothetical protein
LRVAVTYSMPLAFVVALALALALCCLLVK